MIINDETGRIAVDFVIEELVAQGYISQSTYGRMPATLAEEIGEKLAVKLNE